MIERQQHVYVGGAIGIVKEISIATVTLEGSYNDHNATVWWSCTVERAQLEQCIQDKHGTIQAHHLHMDWLK